MQPEMQIKIVGKLFFYLSAGLEKQKIPCDLGKILLVFVGVFLE